MAVNCNDVVSSFNCRPVWHTHADVVSTCRKQVFADIRYWRILFSFPKRRVINTARIGDGNCWNTIVSGFEAFTGTECNEEFSGYHSHQHGTSIQHFEDCSIIIINVIFIHFDGHKVGLRNGGNPFHTDTKDRSRSFNYNYLGLSYLMTKAYCPLKKYDL